MIFSVAVLGQKDCKMLHNLLHMLPQLTSQVISLISERLDETQRNDVGSNVCIICMRREMPHSLVEYQVQGKGEEHSLRASGNLRLRTIPCTLLEKH